MLTRTKKALLPEEWEDSLLPYVSLYPPLPPACPQFPELKPQPKTSTPPEATQPVKSSESPLTGATLSFQSNPVPSSQETTRGLCLQFPLPTDIKMPYKCNREKLVEEHLL